MAVSLSDNAAADIVLRIVHRDATAQYRNWFQPQAAVQLLRRLVDNPSLTREHMDLILGWMRDTPRGVNRIKGALPTGTVVLHKPGTSGTDNGVAHATNDIGLVLLPDAMAQIARAAYVTAITSAR